MLRRDQATVPDDAAVAASLRAAASADTVVYVGCDDGYGGGSTLVGAAREALARQQREASLVSVPISGTLMGVGWGTVAAAVAARAGREDREVIAEAQRVGSATRVLALIEHPPLAGSAAGSSVRCVAPAPSSSCAGASSTWSTGRAGGRQGCSRCASASRPRRRR